MLVFQDCRDRIWTFLNHRDQNLILPVIADLGNVFATEGTLTATCSTKGKLTAAGANKGNITATGATEGKLTAIGEYSVVDFGTEADASSPPRGFDPLTSAEKTPRGFDPLTSAEKFDPPRSARRKNFGKIFEEVPKNPYWLFSRNWHAAQKIRPKQVFLGELGKSMWSIKKKVVDKFLTIFLKIRFFLENPRS